MSRGAWVAFSLSLSLACDREAARDADAKPLEPAAQTSAAPAIVQPVPPRADVIVARESKPEPPLEGHFRGREQRSRVLFLDDGAMVHAWNEQGTEKREPITTEAPAGHRECKVLRSGGSQDFLLCMSWYTGPGGGRVDGVLFDLERRTLGEFFSAAINIELENTLCSPGTMVGPMPSYNMVGWETKAATRDQDAEVHVRVEREGWPSKEAESLRTKKFCECLGREDCPPVPTPPTAASTVVYRLTHGKLQPSEASQQVLEEIAAQWGHNSFLEAWN